MAENKDKIQSELNENAVAQQTTENAGSTTEKYKLEVYDGVTLIPDLVINRESFLSKGKTLWKYKICGKFNDKSVEMELDAGTFYLSGKRYTDTDIYDMLNYLYEFFPERCLGVKSYLDGNERKITFFIVGKAPNGLRSLVPVSFGGRASSLAKLSMLFSDISLRYGVSLPGLF